MARYSSERKTKILNKLLPPSNMTVAEVSREEGISAQTLYNWRSQAKESGLPVPGKKPTTEQWSADAKLAVVIKTAPMSESELVSAQSTPSKIHTEIPLSCLQII